VVLAGDRHFTIGWCPGGTCIFQICDHPDDHPDNLLFCQIEKCPFLSNPGAGLLPWLAPDFAAQNAAMALLGSNGRHLAQVLVGYCLMARCVSMFPWNREEEFSLQYFRKTIFSKPVHGSIKQK